MNGIENSNVRFAALRGNDNHVYFLLGSILVEVESVSIAVKWRESRSFGLGKVCMCFSVGSIMEAF